MITFLDQQTWMDKAEWGNGPWQTEPDRAYWIDAKTGYPCLVRRSEGSGAYCGYVGVPKGHPLFKKDYDQVSDRGIDAHGGLTYSAMCMKNDPARGICHPPLFENDERWWLGFDHAHAFDHMPMMEALLRKYSPTLSTTSHGVYTPLAQVVREVEHLAEQLWEVEHVRQVRNAARRAKANAAATQARSLSGVRD